MIVVLYCKLTYKFTKKRVSLQQMKNIRNFCIIAHIDHGKSTLADRLLELTRTLTDREMENQVLDDMDLEREKGITIKSHAIQMDYQRGGETYRLNLIDTPGHVDFSYEVSRSIASCEGALLVVDASQGIQAQTISNLYQAIDHSLEIIPVLNKIDMDSAQPEVVTDQVCDLLGCDPEDVLRVSARTGEGVQAVLDAIVDKIPAPKGDPEAPLQALIFDSVFNQFRGIIAYFKVLNGSIRTGDKVKFFATGNEYEAEEIGNLKLKLNPLLAHFLYIILLNDFRGEVQIVDVVTGGHFLDLLFGLVHDEHLAVTGNLVHLHAHHFHHGEFLGAEVIEIGDALHLLVHHVGNNLYGCGFYTVPLFGGLPQRHHCHQQGCANCHVLFHRELVIFVY